MICCVGQMVKPPHFHCGNYGFEPRTQYGDFVRNWKRSVPVKHVTSVRFRYVTLFRLSLMDRIVGYEPSDSGSNPLAETTRK